VQFVYGGDLLGNLWKFDLAAGTTSLLATLKDGLGNAQPVTTTPLLTRINNSRVVMVGTGRLLDITDFGGSSVQSFYAIADGALLANARTALTPLAIDNVTKLISGKVDWSTSRGWYFDLPASQVVNTDPALVLGRVFFSANITGGTDCAQSSYGYIVDVLNGSGESAVLSSSVNATRPLLVQSGDRLYRLTRFGDGSVDRRDVTANPGISSRKNAWKLIAR
jgi:type IV pilus assembly protein PilY1